jgi:uncharacterized protein (DUF3084 family)
MSGLSEAERRAVVVAAHDDTCGHNCGSDVSTYRRMDRTLEAAERIVAERTRAAVEEIVGRVKAAACECGGDAVRHTVGADRRCPVHGYGTTVEWRHIRSALDGPAASEAGASTGEGTNGPERGTLTP